jgi:hypothetical protein
MKRGITIDDLPEKYREQVRRQLNQTRGAVTGAEQGVPAKEAGGKRREQNKTELEYNRRYLDNQGLYERVTFHLPGGSRYTPDYMTVDSEGRITFHEVKGSYRLHSHGRARTAFRECVAAYPMFFWVWATRQSSGEYKIETF